jgi:hypothetical protein
MIRPEIECSAGFGVDCVEGELFARLHADKPTAKTKTTTSAR